MKTIGFIVLIAIKRGVERVRGKAAAKPRQRTKHLVNRVQHLILQGGVQGAAGVTC